MTKKVKDAESQTLGTIRTDGLDFDRPRITVAAKKHIVTQVHMADAASTPNSGAAVSSTSSDPAASSTGPGPSGYSGPTYEELLAQVQAHNTAELAHQLAGDPATCFEQGASAAHSDCAYTPNLLPLPAKPQPAAPAGQAAGGVAPARVSQHQVWEQVKTSMTLHPATPHIAPDFTIHHQRSTVTGQPLDSVVGYPVWYWASDGDLTPTTQVKKLHEMTVSLAMTPAGITIDPGDGDPISCPDNGTPWTRQVAAGTTSPTCGHTYTRTGTYTLTMTTRWRVHYTVDNGKDTPLIGDETITATTTRPVRIGEFQVLLVNH